MIDMYMMFKPIQTKCIGFCAMCPLCQETPLKPDAKESDIFYLSTVTNRPQECNALEWNIGLPEFDVLTEQIKHLQDTCKNCFEQESTYKLPVQRQRMILHLYSCANDYLYYPKSFTILAQCLKTKYKWVLLRPRDNDYTPKNIAQLISEARGVPVK